MTPEAFRQAGHQLIDWIADYRNSIEQRPVRAQIEPGQVREKLPQNPPGQSDDFSQLIVDLEDIVVPGITQVQNPMHFGWFPSNASLASVLGDIASSGLGTLGISWESCPALTEVEEVTVDWMRQRPERFEIVANLLSMRHRIRLRVSTTIGREDPTVESLTPLWPGAGFAEREVYDMFGIIFDGHPDLTRILMPDDWDGHPLRKDFGVGSVPVQFKESHKVD